MTPVAEHSPYTATPDELWNSTAPGYGHPSRHSFARYNTYMMESTFARVRNPVCLSCRLLKQSRPSARLQIKSLSTKRRSSPRPSTHNASAWHEDTLSRPQKTISSRRTSLNWIRSASSAAHEIDHELKHAYKVASTILKHTSIPNEKEVLGALRALDATAQHLIELNNLDRPRSKSDGSPASALLALDIRRSKSRRPPPETAAVKKIIDELSDLAYRLVKSSTVFLTPEILARYVDIQTLLLRPGSLPEIFTLYATKPAPSASKSTPDGITYTPSSPSAIAAAVDANVANAALNVALSTRQLSLAFDIIETTFGAPAFQRNKIFRRAVPPITAAVLMPAAAYTLASTMSTVQTGLDPGDFTNIAFAGIFTYAACVGTIGYVALTTANDQMQRVTWAIGMPLKERWLREEERAAADRIALAWGFPEKVRWGDEEGQDWESIREWCGLRGMVLDKVGLMEGME